MSSQHRYRRSGEIECLFPGGAVRLQAPLHALQAPGLRRWNVAHPGETRTAKIHIQPRLSGCSARARHVPARNSNLAARRAGF